MAVRLAQMRGKLEKDMVQVPKTQPAHAINLTHPVDAGRRVVWLVKRRCMVPSCDDTATLALHRPLASTAVFGIAGAATH